MECGLTHLISEVLPFSSFHQGMEWVTLPLITMSQDGVWAESSSNTLCVGLAKFVMGLHTVQCQPVGCLVNVVCLVVLFLQKNQFFMTFCVGQQKANIW